MDNRKISVLDDGYLQLIESWGSDERIIEAARMSTNKGFLGWDKFDLWECLNQSDTGYSCPGYSSTLPEAAGANCPNCDMPLVRNKDKSHPGDMKLLSYLWHHKHTTPFEMAGAIIEVQAPIFVFREWHRHRTQSYNEMSARYTQMPNLHYVPSIERIMSGGQDNKNKQGSVTLNTSLEEAESIRKRLSLTQQYVYDEYEALMKIYGLSKELARINTPVSRYSRMRASANLKNWLGFLTLRLDPAAQWEIREYAKALHSVLANLFPRTMELFDGK